MQTKFAEELCKRLGEYNEEGFTLKDIKHAEEILDIQIKVVCAENFNTIIYSGEEIETKILVYQYKHGNHIDVINSKKAFLGSVYCCNECDKPYNNNNNNRHSCRIARNDVCKLCAKPSHSEEGKNKIYCEDCIRYCFNQKCFDNRADVCKEVYKCGVWNKTSP
jgi:hypothetical protein